MGFWGSLVSEVANAGSWLMQNAGNALKAANAVASAAGVATVDEDALSMNSNIFPKLAGDLRTAEKNLTAVIASLAPEPKPGDDYNVISGPLDLIGIWPEPSLTHEGQVTQPDISGDINKFLSLNGVRTTIGSIDIGSQLAASMFAPGSPANKVLGAELLANGGGVIPLSKFIASPGLGIDSLKENGIKITGKHVHYPIPLGNTGDNAWHSYTRLWVERDQSLDTWEEELKYLSIQPARSLQLDRPYNTTNVSAEWTGTLGAANIMKKSVDKMQKDETFTVQPPHMEGGSCFIYTFRTSVDIGPSAVLNAFSNAISSSLPKDGPNIPLMPRVKIENSTTFP